jgi:hypothetical protein
VSATCRYGIEALAVVMKREFKATLMSDAGELNVRAGGVAERIVQTLFENEEDSSPVVRREKVRLEVLRDGTAKFDARYQTELTRVSLEVVEHFSKLVFARINGPHN